MDSRRFDLLARRLSTRISRRGTIAALLGGAAATATRAGAGAADPARTTCRAANAICRTSTQCCSGICDTGVVAHRTRRNRCGCQAPLTPCGSQCVDTQTSARNCGACGRRCPAGQICRDGACAIPSCADSDALVCLETTEGTIVELGHECLAGFQVGCRSKFACDRALADSNNFADFPSELRHLLKVECATGGIYLGEPLDLMPDGLCMVYLETWVDGICD